MNVPTNARAWITRHEDELVYIQQLANTHQINAALQLAELTEEYASKFDRVLIDDLTVIYGTVN
jgi:hypothetical protein